MIFGLLLGLGGREGGSSRKCEKEKAARGGVARAVGGAQTREELLYHLQINSCPASQSAF